MDTILQLISLLSVHTVCVYCTDYSLTPIELNPIPCNDKAVEKLSRLATTYINEDRTEGYKFALNRIANVHLHAQGPGGNVYYLDLDVLETKCHVGSQKPWKRCDVRPFMETQISGNCNTTILHTPTGYSYLYSYECHLVPDPPEKLQLTCPTCPVLLPDHDQMAQNSAQATLLAYKRKSKLATELGVKKVTRASSQEVPVKAYFVEYTVQECPEGVTERATCQRLTLESDTETVGFCTGAVYGDFYANPELQVSCEMFKRQNVDILRPVQPQGHDLPLVPEAPTFMIMFEVPKNDPLPVPSDPTLAPVFEPAPSDPLLVDPATLDPVPLDPVPVEPVPVDPVPVDPSPVIPAPFDPSVVVNPSSPFSSSSSESDEDQQRKPQVPDASDSSSEEIAGFMALRPPLNFRYQRRERKKRQALLETSPSQDPFFLAEFPGGPSPFRSCPGPSRFTTV